MADSLNEPRYPSLKGIMGAKKKPQETKALADIGVDAGGRAGEAGLAHHGHRASARRRRAGTRSRSRTTARGAQKILDFLVERKLV